MTERSQADSTLATALWPDTRGQVLRAVVLVLAGTALLALSAKFKVPFYPVPMTLQTLAVLVIAAAYGWKLGVATILAYIAEGFFGLPVFANTPPQIAGPAYLVGPTAGFIMSWILVALIVGYAADRGWDRSVPKLGAAMLLGSVVQFVMGFAWLAWFATLPSGATGIGASAAWAGGVEPFLPAAVLKLAVAALIVPAGWRLIRRLR